MPQVIRPQQSLEVVHDPPDSWQHRFDVGAGRHESAVQHCVAWVHEAAVAMHDEPPVHTPELQVCPTQHALPHDPQLLGSVWRSASPVHGPSTHAPASLQVRWRMPQLPQATNVTWPGVHDVQGPST